MTVNELEELADVIIRLTRERNESLRQAAQRSGLSHGTLSAIARGTTKPTIDTCLKLADHFRIDPNRLLSLAGHKPLPRLSEWRRGRDMQIKELRSQINNLSQRLGVGEHTVALPIYGRIPAGWPDDVIEEPLGYFSVPFQIVYSPDAFWLVVAGNSMEGAGVDNGDLVLVDPGREWQDGDIVAARLSDGRSVLRRAYQEDDHMRLEAANEEYDVIQANDVEIYGVATRVVKELK